MKCIASNERLLNKVKEEERQRMARLYAAATIYTAFDKCGLDEETVAKLTSVVMDVADSIIRGYTKIEDYEQIVEKNTEQLFVILDKRRG